MLSCRGCRCLLNRILHRARSMNTRRRVWPIVLLIAAHAALACCGYVLIFQRPDLLRDWFARSEAKSPKVAQQGLLPSPVAPTDPSTHQPAATKDVANAAESPVDLEALARQYLDRLLRFPLDVRIEKHFEFDDKASRQWCLCGIVDCPEKLSQDGRYSARTPDIPSSTRAWPQPFVAVLCRADSGGYFLRFAMVGQDITAEGKTICYVNLVDHTAWCNAAPGRESDGLILGTLNRLKAAKDCPVSTKAVVSGLVADMQSASRSKLTKP